LKPCLAAFFIQHQHPVASSQDAFKCVSHLFYRLPPLVLRSLHVVAIGSLTKDKPLVAKTSVTLPSKGAPIVGLWSSLFSCRALPR
jgi:hypothetical protein